ncbi:MAG: hypothetical protein KF757_12165 [Phycisphaeraceae bacterium]|nr:hypothetical protein [Phycisphaeraceae bacterium]MCW5762445.1 hypothetical protein [Phycisphaeraceae bacterium]
MNAQRALIAFAGAVISSGAVADPHVFTIYAQAPATALPGETITVEIWGQVHSPLWVQGTSMVAGFGIDVLGTGAISNVAMGEFAWWAERFGTNGTVSGTNVLGTSGGQLWLLFGDCWFPPCWEYGNPVLLFTIEARAGLEGSMTFTPANPNINGGMSFYPVDTDGASIVGPNDAGTSLHTISATTIIIPTPATVLVGAGAAILLSRRRRA